MNETIYRYSEVNSTFTTELWHREANWATLVKYFTTFRMTNSKSGRLFTGWQMVPHDIAIWMPEGLPRSEQHYSRRKENCFALHFLTLDVDQKFAVMALRGLPIISFNEYAEELAALRLQAIMYTTYSNQCKNHDDEVAPRFRVILPLAQPMLYSAYDCRIPAIKELFPYAAKESFVASQPYYPPIYHIARSGVIQSRIFEGERLDLYDIEIPKDEHGQEIAPQQQSYRPAGGDNKFKSDDIRRVVFEELKKLADNNVFDETLATTRGGNSWLSLGSALFNEGYDLADFQALSWPHASKECERLWRFWRHNRSPVNSGYLINTIRKNGNPRFLESSAAREERNLLGIQKQLKKRNIKVI